MSIGDFANQEPKDTEWKDPSAPTKEENTANTIVSPSGNPTSQNSASATITTPPPSATPQTPDSIVKNILDEIGDIGSGSNFKLMVYGPPGGTKSSFLATAPNNLIADYEDGLVSAKVSPNGIADGVKQLRMTGFNEFIQVVKGIRDDDPRLKPFEVFSLDTLSDLHKKGLAEVVLREYRKAPSSANQYVADTPHHTENNERILRLIRTLRDTRRDLIISCHSRTVEPKGRAAKTYADFSESLSQRVMAMMDVVGYMEKRKVDGKIVPVMVFEHENIHCKSRIGLPHEVINPTYPQIRKFWEELKDK